MCINVCVYSSGEKGTLTHGSIVDGKFEGFIQSHAGMYYVEPAERYLGERNVPYHSVIYHEDDIGECMFTNVCVCVRTWFDLESTTSVLKASNGPIRNFLPKCDRVVSDLF